MVLDRIEFLHRYLPDFHIEIDNFLKSISSCMKDGKYNIAGEKVFAQVMSYSTKPEADCRIEAHDLYVDIQSVITGAEGIGLFDRETLTANASYDDEKDVWFFDSADPLNTVAVHEGWFAMIFPHEAHRPQTAVGLPNNIKKFVIKISKDLFKDVHRL